jgi:hypothetical protein
MPKTSSFNNLNIGMWNIQGLTEEKTDEHAFKNFVNKLHIVSFVETWNDSGKYVNNIHMYMYLVLLVFVIVLGKNIEEPGEVLMVLQYVSKTVYLKVYLICLVVILILSGLNWTANSA